MKKNTRTFDPVKKMSNQNSYKEKFQGGGGSLGGISRGFSTFQMSFECFFCDSFNIIETGEILTVLLIIIININMYN